MDLKNMTDDYVCMLYESTMCLYHFERLNIKMVDAYPDYYKGLDAEAVRARYELQQQTARRTLTAIWEERHELLKAKGFAPIE